MSADEQRRQTADAHARWQRELGEARVAILDSVQRFKATGRLDRKLVGDVRVLGRGVARIDANVGLRQ